MFLERFVGLSSNFIYSDLKGLPAQNRTTYWNKSSITDSIFLDTIHFSIISITIFLKSLGSPPKVSFPVIITAILLAKVKKSIVYHELKSQFFHPLLYFPSRKSPLSKTLIQPARFPSASRHDLILGSLINKRSISSLNSFTFIAASNFYLISERLVITLNTLKRHCLIDKLFRKLLKHI